MFDQRSYGTDPATAARRYEALRATAREFKPLIIVAGCSPTPDQRELRIMREIAGRVGATLMVDMAHFAGLPSPARSSPVTSTRCRTREDRHHGHASRCAARVAAWS
ncbi:hypothetical protein [Streptomyces sp. KL116D]|uniref:hypothetical protein n=1 Tax=Streptomyces sp. KL116D TaxID=3045152 RepID=UPI003556E4B7